jgi:O-antigen/teichoic acid export membrane protein
MTLPRGDTGADITHGMSFRRDESERRSAVASGRPSLLRNVLSNWGATATAIAYSLVITPVVVRALDRDLYGVWSFLNGLLAYSNLFYLGLGAAVIRYVAQYAATGDRTALNRLASVVLSIYTVLGALCFLAMACVAPYVPRILTAPPDAGTAQAASLTAVLLGARLFLMFVGSVFTGVLVARGRLDLNNLVAISGTTMRFVAVPLSVRSGNPLLSLAIVVVATGALETVAQIALAFKVDPELAARPVFPRRADFSLLYSFGILSFLMQVAERLISYTDTTVIGVMLGAGSVALYAIPLQLAEYARIAVYGIVSVLLPHLTSMYERGQARALGDAYVRSVRTVAFVSAFLNVNLIFLGVPFLRLWVGPTFADAAPMVLLCLGSAGFLQAVGTQIQVPFCQTLRTLRFPAVVLLLEAAANLVLSVLLARRWGIAGVAFATAVPAMCGSVLLVPAYVARRVGVPLRTLVRGAVAPTGGLVVALVAVHWTLRALFPANAYWLLGAKGTATVPVALAVAFLTFPADERTVGVSAVRGIWDKLALGQARP